MYRKAKKSAALARSNRASANLANNVVRDVDNDDSLEVNNVQLVANVDPQEYAVEQLDGNIYTLQATGEQRERYDGVLLSNIEEASVEQQTGNDDSVENNVELTTGTEDNMETISKRY